MPWDPFLNKKLESVSKNVSIRHICKYFHIIIYGPLSKMSVFNASFCFACKSRVKRFLHRLCKKRWTMRCWHAQLSLNSSTTSLFILVRTLSKLWQKSVPMHSLSLLLAGLAERKHFPWRFWIFRATKGDTAGHKVFLSLQEPLSFPSSLLYPFCFLYPQEARCF